MDDLILLPLGLCLALKLIPEEVMLEARQRAQERAPGASSRRGAAFVILIWLALAGMGLLYFFR